MLGGMQGAPQRLGAGLGHCDAFFYYHLFWRQADMHERGDPWGRRHDAMRSAADHRRRHSRRGLGSRCSAAHPQLASWHYCCGAVQSPPPAETQSSSGSEAATHSCESCMYAL